MAPNVSSTCNQIFLLKYQTCQSLRLYEQSDICPQTFSLLEFKQRGKLEENCELQGTDDVQRQLSELAHN